MTPDMTPLAVFVSSLSEEFLKERESIQFENIFFTVQRVAKNRILYVLATFNGR